MQVNVYISQTDTAEKYQLLVIPFGANAAIPDDLQHIAWRHLAMTRLDDRLLATAEPMIRAQMDINGYGLVRLAS